MKIKLEARNVCYYFFEAVLFSILLFKRIKIKENIFFFRGPSASSGPETLVFGFHNHTQTRYDSSG